MTAQSISHFVRRRGVLAGFLLVVIAGWVVGEMNLANAKPVSAEIGGVVSRVVEYEASGVTLRGEFFAPASAKGKLPGVLVVHEWWGLNDHARNAAKRLAEAGYAAFALDMFGGGKLAAHPDDAKAFVAEATKDAGTAKARFEAAIAVLRAQPEVEGAKLAAIGYCFGGGLSLEMARRGVDLRGVVSFHGNLLPVADKAGRGQVKAAIQVHHGAADPMIPMEAVASFAKEMEEAGARYMIQVHGGAKHSFTNPEADKRGVPGLAYDVTADRRSWVATLAFLQEVLTP